MKKICNNCDAEKNLSDFARDKSCKDGRHSHCKVCRRAAARLKYSDDKLANRRVYDAARSAKRIELLRKKKESGCELCGETTYACLDLHHRDPSEKEFSIDKNRSIAEPRFIAELAKCAVLCSNCHRKVHAGLISLLR